MADLKLSFGGVDYWDRSLALIDGSVKPEGIELEYEVMNPGVLFRRIAQKADFDAAEMSMSTYMALVTRGDRRLIALPVFPSRNFRHGYIYVNAKAGIERPEDLKGKRMGTPEYQQTAAVWMRGFLEHDYGVQPKEMDWFTGGTKTAGYVERSHLDLPPEINFSVIPEDRYLEEMLDCGDLDALMSPVAPDPLYSGEGNVRRLFPDYRTVEKDYFKRTGIYPVMHTVIIRREIYDENPWVATSLFEAFEAAKRRGRERLVSTGALAISLPWVPADLEEMDEVFGGNDPWVYGLEPNRKMLETLIELSLEQGLSTRRLTLEELFVDDSLLPAPATKSRYAGLALPA